MSSRSNGVMKARSNRTAISASISATRSSSRSYETMSSSSARAAARRFSPSRMKISVNASSRGIRRTMRQLPCSQLPDADGRERAPGQRAREGGGRDRHDPGEEDGARHAPADAARPFTGADAHDRARDDVRGGDGHPEMSRDPVSYTHLRAHETRHDLVCRLL